MHVPLLAFFAGVSSVFAVGCGCATATDFAPVTFTPSSVKATRTPATCGVADPSAAADDTLTLTVVGATDVPPPYNTLTLTLNRTVTPNLEMPLNVPMKSSATPAALQTASSTDSSVRFSFLLGSDPGEVDSNAIASVLVTVVAIPAADGEPLRANLDVAFVDGRELDATYAAPITTSEVACTGSP